MIIFGGYDNGNPKNSGHINQNLKQIGKVIKIESQIDKSLFTFNR